MGHTQAWKVDLRQQSKYAVEPAGPVVYWWPGAMPSESGGPGAAKELGGSTLLQRRFRWKRQRRPGEPGRRPAGERHRVPAAVQ